jgi:hypothetical protein
MMDYGRNMQRYIGCAGCSQGVGGILDWLFAPGITAAEQMAKDIKAAEEAKAAAAAAAAAQPTEEMQQRLAAAEAQLAQLKAQQAQQAQTTPPVVVQQPQAAGINWVALGALGLGAYFLFSKKKPARRRAASRRRTTRRRRRRR